MMNSCFSSVNRLNRGRLTSRSKAFCASGNILLGRIQRLARVRLQMKRDEVNAATYSELGHFGDKIVPIERGVVPQPNAVDVHGMQIVPSGLEAKTG